MICKISATLPYILCLVVYILIQWLVIYLFTNVIITLFTFVNMTQAELIDAIFQSYSSFKKEELQGRYITFDHISPEIKKLPENFKVKEIGNSVLKTPIPAVTFGTGPIKIFAWSQMHGNESTTTKAVFDLMNLFSSHGAGVGVSKILETCTIKIIPMLNPDGAVRYTRENSNNTDLNRDAQKLEELESRILRECFNSFQPHFCLNLHDQRTIFSAGDTNNPATLSFLAPAMDPTRSINPQREKAMLLIAAMNKILQKYLPEQVGRYDDAFNINCTGDFFQALNVPTILFEAGHYPNDYQREETRKYMALAIFAALLNISTGTYDTLNLEDYYNIPENKKNFYDLILKRAKVEGNLVEVAIQYEEKVQSGKISFVPVIKSIGASIELYAHREIDCEGKEVTKEGGEILCENDIVNQIMLNSHTLSIKME